MSTNAWSEPAENLLDEAARACDVLVIGSGYGGSIAASQLANGQRKVWVLERGREYRLGEFPEDIGQLPGHVRLQRDGRSAVGTADALFDVRSFEGGSVLLGSGLGGGSLVNAGVALQPSHALFRQKAWPQGIRDLKNSELDALFAEARRLLGAEPLPDAHKLPKFQALARLARSRGARAEPVPITVAGTDLPANAERPVDLKACIRCGNCFTGCNYGAKRTLATNLIPAAVGKGARFFTGAQAMRIEERADASGARYRVHFRLVADRVEQVFTIDARTVIVSAGTLGSTELLLRSQDETQNPLKVSRQIGERFSGNGDAIALGFGQRRPVKGFAHPVVQGRQGEVGPTITGVIRTEVDVGDETREALIQDGAVPYALGRSAVTLGSTLSLFHRYLGDGIPGFFADRDQKDWVASPLELRDHTQVLLAMGADEANGKLEWKDGQLRVQLWPKPAKADGDEEAADFQEGMHQWFRAAGREGFDGGDYLANPMFRALPDDFAEIAGAGAQAGARVTVHPLGGCAMGDDIATGVVDQFGAVFRPGGGVYDGLHVLDGAIIPCATVANPLLTISALALRAARQVDRAIGGAVGVTNAVTHAQPRVEPLLATGEGGIALTFRETLWGPPGSGPMPAWLQSLLNDRGLSTQGVQHWVAVVRVTIALDDWLEDPSRPLPACLALWASSEPMGLEVNPALTKKPPLLEGDGKVTLLALDAPGPLEAWARVKDAVECFSQRRPGEADIWGAIQRPGAALSTALNHTLYRELRYDFQVEGGTGPGAVRCRLGGVKKLAYATGARNLWDALLQLPLELRQEGTKDGYDLTLEVDLVDMIKNRRLQVTEAPSTPAAIVGLAAFTAQWVRALVQTHFWSFRGLSYDKLPPPAQVPPPPATLEGASRRTLTLPVSCTQDDPEPLPLELHEYKPASPKGCILLIHGLAHGSGVFTTGTIERNLAAHFLRQHYTVWLLDHRLSNRLPHAAQEHAIDDVARFDVAEAIRFVYRENGNQPIDVFAHCVGAAAFSMAVLRGGWDVPGAVPVGSLVRSAIIHAVHPWVVPSATNRLSAALAALYKDLLPKGLKIDPVPTRKSDSALDEVIDRIAATLPWPKTEGEPHEHGRRENESGYATCNRMTLFYGREWRHGNLDQRTHDGLRDLVGVGGLNVFRQLFFIALRRRLTDRGGENVYLTQKNFNAHWNFPTLFAHGADNRVFDVRSAVQSWKRLTMVHQLRPGKTRPPVRLFVPEENYGHMDFLFGKEAARHVYPSLTAFLQNPEDFKSKVGETEVRLDVEPPQVILVNGQDITDSFTGIPRDPLCGPMVQVDQGPNGRKLVLWCEQGADATSNFAPPGVRINCRELTPSEFACVHSAPSGAGICWVITVPEPSWVTFGDVTRIELELRYDGSIPYVKSDLSPTLQADLLAGLKHGWFHKVISLGTKVAGGSKAMLLPEAAPLPAPAKPPAPPPAWREIDITRTRWWERWAKERGGPRPETAFLATSCRWPGLPFERDAIHRLAVPMLAHVNLKDDKAAQGLLLLGDQIYVDATANVTETTEAGERGPQRYRDAWEPGTPSGLLLEKVPVWMVVDDHEFGDDLGEFATPGDDDENLTLGFAATVAFQWRHKLPRPRRWRPAPPTGQGPALPACRGFWYRFEIGGLPAFAADTRTERESRRDANAWRSAKIMSAKQAMALEQWLLEHRHEPKLLCSGSVFGLPTRQAVEHPAARRREDDWSGYPASCERLARFIVANDIRNLVFVSGDYHFSAMACLRLEHGGKSVHAISVASSGWNATLPFANAHEHDYPWNQPVTLDSGATRVLSRASLLSTAPRQFSKVTVTRVGADCKVKAQVFDATGAELKAMEMELPPTGACA